MDHIPDFLGLATTKAVWLVTDDMDWVDLAVKMHQFLHKIKECRFSDLWEIGRERSRHLKELPDWDCTVEPGRDCDYGPRHLHVLQLQCVLGRLSGGPASTKS